MALGWAGSTKRGEAALAGLSGSVRFVRPSQVYWCTAPRGLTYILMHQKATAHTILNFFAGPYTARRDLSMVHRKITKPPVPPRRLMTGAICHPSGGPSAPGRRLEGERGAPLRCAPTPHSWGMGKVLHVLRTAKKEVRMAGNFLLIKFATYNKRLPRISLPLRRSAMTSSVGLGASGRQSIAKSRKN